MRRRAERLRRAALRAAVAAGIAATVFAGNGDAVAAGRRTHQIVIQGLQYVPETLKVKRGDVVVWVNKDPFPHTVTAAGAFDSKSIAAEKSWRFTTRGAGTFAYVCTLHSNMKGTLEVE